MNTNGFEIERKFLIAYPSDELLRGLNYSEITQTYLENLDRERNERVRKRVYSDKVEYTHTVKIRMSNIRRQEDETVITEEEYLRLLKRTDKSRRTILKTRYCLEYKGQVFEIDVYPFWFRQAVMELEMESEEQKIEFPPQITVLREVTEDRHYNNSAMARAIPLEDV